MEDLEKAKFKDDILKLCFRKKSIGIQDIQTEFHKYRCTPNYTIGVLQELGSYRYNGRKLINYHEGKGNVHVVMPEPALEEFIETGGFVSEYNRYREAAIKTNEVASQDKRIKDLTEQNLRLSNQLNQQKIKTHWIPIGISIVSLICSVLIPIVISSMKRPNQSDIIRLDIVEGKIGNLRKEYEKKNDSLYEEMMKFKLLTQPYVINPLSGDTLQKPH